jgi:hypothetical protein
MVDEYRADNYDELVATADTVATTTKTKVVKAPEAPAAETSDAPVETKA